MKEAHLFRAALLILILSGTAANAQDAGVELGDAGDASELRVPEESTDAGSLEEPALTPPPVAVQPPQRPQWKPPSGLYLKEPPFSHRFPRIAVMFFMSGLSEAAGAVVGGMVGCAVVPYGPQGCLPGFLWGGLIGGVLGIPVGAAVGGYLMDGNGSIYATFAGLVAGVAIDLGLMGYVIYNAQTDPVRGTFITMAFLLLPNLTSIVAYEMTSDRSRRYTEMTEQMKGTAPSAKLVPILAPTSDGRVIGGLALQGRW